LDKNEEFLFQDILLSLCGVDWQMSDEKKKEEALQRANRILESVMVYYQFFIPAHSDGRTVAEFLGIRPPDWILPILTGHREAELPFHERKIIEDDLSHFIGILSSSITKDIMEDGAKTERSKVVLQIMEELAKDDGGKKREDLLELEREAYSRQSSSDEDEADELEEDAGMPRIVIPFVTVYRARKKNRTRVLFNTYKGNIRVSFFGKEHTVEIEDEAGEDQESVFVAYCYPTTADAGVGTRLGVIKLKRDLVELSSTVEERHRALRDFVLKLVGENGLSLEKQMVHAVLDPETGEPTTERMMMEESATKMIEGRSKNDLVADGLEACIVSGIVIKKKETPQPIKEEESLIIEVSSRFMRDLLQDYYDKIAMKKGSPNPDALLGAISQTVLNYTSMLSENEGAGGANNLVYDSTVAFFAFASVVIDCAKKDGKKEVARAFRRLIDFKPVGHEALTPLVEYLKELAGRNSNDASRYL
jgi:hypothetical protein